MSESQDILDLVDNGESQTLEFKKSLSLRTEGLKALCGMLNSEVAQGMVLFGVMPDGSVCGVEPGNLDKAQRSLSQHIAQKFDPAISPTIEVVTLKEAAVVVICASRSKVVPYHEYDGRAYIRVGTETQTLSIVQKDDLRKRRDRNSHNGPWKCDHCASWVGMLVASAITQDGLSKTYRCSCGGEFWPA